MKLRFLLELRKIFDNPDLGEECLILNTVQSEVIMTKPSFNVPSQNTLFQRIRGYSKEFKFLVEITLLKALYLASVLIKQSR